MSKDTTANVWLWGTRVGAVTWVAEERFAYYQYDESFLNSGVNIAPFTMPLRETPYVFPALSFEAFKGLPGMLADVLPDKFGNRLIDAWLAQEGRLATDFNPVERLCYVGSRGMGALEFKPSTPRAQRGSTPVDVASLVSLVNQVLDERTSLAGRLDDNEGHEPLDDILRVGTSAGGARAKAVLAWNPQSHEFHSGQTETDPNFEHWLLKFDGVSNNRDKELADPQGFGLIEFAYYQMATDCGIEMMPCRLFEEGGRSHFMTKRFDRISSAQADGSIVTDKLHMQSLGAMQHYDFNDSMGYSYEQALVTIRELGLGISALEQQFRRTVFNVIARNQDDHVKNIAFLMDRQGQWHLSPAYDVTYSYNPSGDWTSVHQMSVNAKRDAFSLQDFILFGKAAGLKKTKASDIVASVIDVVSRWQDYAKNAGIDQRTAKQIQLTHRLSL